MKKIIAGILTFVSLLNFVSCGNTQTDTTTTEIPNTNTDQTEHTMGSVDNTTAQTTNTTSSISHTTTQSTNSIETESTTVHTWNYPAPIIPVQKEEYGKLTFEQGENIFEAFYQLYPENSLEDDVIRPSFLPDTIETGLIPIILIYRIVAIEEFPTEKNNYSVYHLQIVDAYGDVTYDKNQIYRMAFQGSETIQRYGLPTLEIGKIYARCAMTNLNSDINLQKYHLDDPDRLWAPLPIYEVEEIDGKRYIYTYYKNFSKMECKIEINDHEENSVYKPGKHDKQIAELERLDVPLPTYDYKCELDAFYSELEKKLS